MSTDHLELSESHCKTFEARYRTRFMCKIYGKDLKARTEGLWKRTAHQEAVVL